MCAEVEKLVIGVYIVKEVDSIFTVAISILKRLFELHLIGTEKLNVLLYHAEYVIFREHLNFRLVLIVLNSDANQLLEALYPVDSLVALILNMPWIIIYSQLMLSGNSDIANVHRLSDRRRELVPYLRVFPLSHR